MISDIQYNCAILPLEESKASKLAFCTTTFKHNIFLKFKNKENLS
jgi:hypothetical protein